MNPVSWALDVPGRLFVVAALLPLLAFALFGLALFTRAVVRRSRPLAWAWLDFTGAIGVTATLAVPADSAPSDLTSRSRAVVADAVAQAFGGSSDSGAASDHDGQGEPQASSTDHTLIASARTATFVPHR